MAEKSNFEYRSALLKLDTRKIKLGGVKTFTILKAPFAIKARSGIKDLAIKVDQMKSQKYSKRAISETIDKKLDEIKENYRNSFDEYVKNVVSEYEEQVQKKADPKYGDPTAELLKRQDIDQKIALMGINDLNEYIQKLPSDVSSYELNQLEIAAKKKNSPKLVSGINAFKLQQPTLYEKDSDFKKTATKAAELKTIIFSGMGSKYIWNEEGEPLVGIEKSFKASLNDYE